MTETGVSRRVDKVAVRVVQRDLERVFISGLGELRTYNGSRLLKLVTGLSILGKAHIKVAEDLYHEIEEDGEKVDHGAHKGG
jgi:hypothetical protein